MSKFEKLNVNVRDEKGTSSVRRIRLQNQIPAVLYHSGLDALSLSIDKKELYKALNTGQVIFEVTVQDENQFVLVKDVQYVKAGGILVQIVSTITVQCKPTTIPEALIIDVTNLELNSSLFVKDIQLAADVEIMTSEDLAVVSVQEPKEEEVVEEEVLEGEELLEGEEGEEGEKDKEGEEGKEGEDGKDGKEDSSEGKKEGTKESKDQKPKEEKQK